MKIKLLFIILTISTLTACKTSKENCEAYSYYEENLNDIEFDISKQHQRRLENFNTTVVIK